jgi:hypothetical protein
MVDARGAVPLVEVGYATRSTSWWTLDEEETTPELRWPLNIQVYDRMRRQDAQVISVVRAVTLPILRTPWRLDPNGARPEVVDLVADDLGLPVVGQGPRPALRTRDRFSWQDHLRLALLMMTFGHAFFEQVYRIDETGRARLRKLGYRPPTTISKVEVAGDGGLVSIEQHDVKKPIPVDRLVAYVNDREGGNWLGQSFLRPAYKFWLLKDRMLRIQAQTIDRNGLGVPIYTASELHDSIRGDDRVAQQSAELDKGLELARKFRSGEHAGAAIPHGATLRLAGVDGKLPDPMPVIKYYDEQIARAVLAHFLNLGGDQSTGSYALGDTFADFFVSSLQATAMNVADVTTQHVVEDLVDVNWGPNEPAPRIVWDEIGSHQAATADAIKNLLDAAAITPDESLETFLRERYGLPQKTTPTPPADEETP